MVYSGLKWLKAGDIEPTTGCDLELSGFQTGAFRLAEALQNKTEFTKQEWEDFDINNLRKDHFVKSGDNYFKPAGQKNEKEAEKKCKGACVHCLCIMAGQMKLHRAQHLLTAHKASLASLSEASERMLFGQSDSATISRDSLLADSIVGKCILDGDEYEMACCIIDLASDWGLEQRTHEIGKMLSKTGGATAWMRCNDWGISAKPPDKVCSKLLSLSPAECF